jgi:hypothetical protein
MKSMSSSRGKLCSGSISVTLVLWNEALQTKLHFQNVNLGKQSLLLLMSHPWHSATTWPKGGRTVYEQLFLLISITWWHLKQENKLLLYSSPQQKEQATRFGPNILKMMKGECPRYERTYKTSDERTNERSIYWQTFMPHQQKETSETFGNTMKFLITKDYNIHTGYVQRCSHNNKVPGVQHAVPGSKNWV